MRIMKHQELSSRLVSLCFILWGVFLNTNCVVVDSTELFSIQHSISESFSAKQSEPKPLNKDTSQFKEFVRIFFADSVYQRKHVCFPLVLCYWEEYDDNDNSSYRQNTKLINDTNYQILILDGRSEIKIIESEGRESYVIVSIPDTALEAELYFQKNKDIYLLNKINITGDASPFNYQ